jgi:hypothetical protein
VKPLHEIVTTSLVNEVPGLATPPRPFVPAPVESDRVGGSAIAD